MAYVYNKNTQRVFTSNGVIKAPEVKGKEISFVNNESKVRVNGIITLFILILSIIGVPYILINLQSIINLNPDLLRPDNY